MMDIKAPPQNNEAEMSILGGILLDNGAFDTVAEYIQVDDFYRQAHRLIFTAISRLRDKNEPVDLITLITALKSDGELDTIGGGAYIAALVDYVPTAANVAYYCKLVAEKALERKLLSCTMAATAGIHGNTPVDAVIEQLETGLTAITAKTEINEPVASIELVKKSMKRVEQRHERGTVLQGMSWGIDELDNATTGIQKGELIIIAGRPSMGKTVLALNIGRSVCTQDKSVLLFSLEMPGVDCIDRIISDYGNVKFHHLRTGGLVDLEWNRYSEASASIAKWALTVDDTPGATLARIKSKAKKQKRAGLDLVIVDYLQLMGINGNENRTQALGNISRGLKTLARELDIAVILLSQLNRSVDGRPDKRPLMSDLRDSGEIEQDADVIIFPFRPAAYCQLCRDRVDNHEHDLREHLSEASIILEKQRNGERNLTIPVIWQGEFQRFKGL